MHVWYCRVLFFQCLVAISKLPSRKGPGRKELLASIEDIKEQLVDWYNDFSAPNPNAMVSLLDAELMMAKNVGKKEFPSIKIQLAFEEAISAARDDEMKHLEAFCCERAALHFEAAKLDGYVKEYLRKAIALYDQWNALAKIIDIEDKYADLLKISQQRSRPIAMRPARNQDEEFEERRIGGGQGPIRPVNVRKALKKGAKNTRREIKALFGIRRGPANASKSKGESPPGSPGSKSTPIRSPRRLPPPKASPFARKQRPAKPRKPGMEGFGDDSFTVSQDSSPSESPASPSKKSPGGLKSPRFAKPKLKLPFGGSRKSKKGSDKKAINGEEAGDDGE